VVKQASRQAIREAAKPSRKPAAIDGREQQQVASEPQAGPSGAAPPLAAWKLDQQALFKLQNDYVGHATELIGQFASGKPPELRDRRFSSKAWLDQPQFAWQAAWYLLNADYLQKTAELIDADQKTRDRIRFMTQQWIDACSPANFLASNPEAQEQLVKTGGESLRNGIANMLGDISQGRISQTDLGAFEVGRNVGTSPGSVVFENELVQLIQYDPVTETVGARPLLIVPPSINKFYILDLQPENSFIGHAVAQGNTVFVVSWRNVKQDQSTLTWDDYLQLGVVDTIAVVQEITGQKTINTLGFCVGGTILCAALAALAAKGQRPAETVTLLTTLLDFGNPGTLGIFIDEMHVALRERTIGNGGIMSGSELATTFTTLRPKDLVWNYVVNNYLKGESPPPFDLLYWNADSTNLPGPMFCWYLRHMYLQNELREPGKLTSLGERIDLRGIGAPAYVLCTSEDHIVPWQGGFASAQALGGAPRFVVGASGHIAGVINPPAKKKRSFRTGPEIDGLDAESWLSRSTEHPGSWWTDWDSWLGKHKGPKVRAPKAPGGGIHKAIEPAPGRYVKEKAA
jgi:polyhydroxyalkanoate synthase